jgi:hypothetical protein
MKKIILLLISISILTVSCGENKKEKIEKETAKILVTYNEAISKQKIAVSEKIEAARFFNLTDTQFKMLNGSDWQQKGWDTLRTYYKIDSLETAFKNTFGEDEYNILQLKVDNNWNEKMK